MHVHGCGKHVLYVSQAGRVAHVVGLPRAVLCVYIAACGMRMGSSPR
jgi:hypothetical protein